MRNLGVRRQLARRVRKLLADYLYWLEACGRDEAKAHRVLLTAWAELGRLIGLDAAAPGTGGADAGGLFEIERLASQLDEGARLLGQAGAHARMRAAVLSPALQSVPGSWQGRQHRPGSPDASGLDYETCHRIALARELTYAAGCPLRDRYGFAASDADVLFVINAVFREPDDIRARRLIGAANGDQIELAMACDTITDEEYEMSIVRALRPLAEQRRDAAGQGL